MLRLVLAALLALAAVQGHAQTARVISGDHDGFSRLVIELPAPSDWQLGRTADGYALRIATPPSGYDLSGVFDMIRRDRLASIGVDPANGDLALGLACACHAIPFEFRPGVIVIDLRDGPPPKGSSFESQLAAQPFRSATADAPPKRRPSVPETAPETPQDQTASDTGRQRGEAPARWTFSPVLRADTPPAAPERGQGSSGWYALDKSIRTARTAPPDPRAFTPPSAPMEALRDSLLRDLSHGAARGVVEIAEAPPAAAKTPAQTDGAAFAQVAVDPLPGLVAGTVDDIAPMLTASGAVCIDDARLDVALWGRPKPAAEEMATLSSGLVGEFDRVDPEALSSAIRYALHLGFGLEAARLAEAFPTPDLPDAPVWKAMGRLIDGYPEPQGVFAGMLSCDSAAALWAALSQGDLGTASEINTSAILRSFSALPLHLRLAIGSHLADSFLAIGRDDVVQAIRDAIARAPEGAGAEADLISAKLQLAKGDAAVAGDLAKGIIETAGPAVPEAMRALVAASLAQDKPIDEGTTDALAAILRESQGTPIELPLAIALMQAQASNGSADAAFDLARTHPEGAPELWSVLARLGADSDLLAHAIQPRQALPTDVSSATALRVASRLLNLGFAPAAQDWLARVEDGEDRAILAARAALMANDPARALEVVGVRRDPVAAAIAAEAELRIGNADAAARLYDDLGDAAAAEGARVAARDWSALSAMPDGAWSKVAGLVPDPRLPLGDLPPLAQAGALVEESGSARQTLEAFLATTGQMPAVPAAKP